MTDPKTTEVVGFTQQDIVYDDDCVEECGKDEKLSHVNRDDPEEVIHESCLLDLRPRFRELYISISDVPSGKLTAAERVDAAIGESLDEDEELAEYKLDEPIQANLD